MKLVFIYSVSDDCTYSCEFTLPIEYESAEALIVNFENAARSAYSSKKLEFVFANHTFDASCFFTNNYAHQKIDYICPEIMTIDEWFEKYN